MQCSAAGTVEKKFGAVIDKPRDQVSVTSSGGQVKRCHAVEVAIIHVSSELGRRQLTNSSQYSMILSPNIVTHCILADIERLLIL